MPHDKKRHHSSKASAKIGVGKYGGLDSRESLEGADFHMFGENRSEFANMPRELVLKPFPKAGKYSEYGLDDTIGGVDKQMDADGSGLKRHGRGSKRGEQ